MSSLASSVPGNFRTISVQDHSSLSRSEFRIKPKQELGELGKQLQRMAQKHKRRGKRDYIVIFGLLTHQNAVVCNSQLRDGHF